MAKIHRRKLRQIGRAAALSAEERLRQILDDRTESLASRRGGKAEAPAGRHRILVCLAGRERFGLPVETVAAVLPYRPCVPSLMAIPALLGHFGRAGHLISVVDLGLALGLKGNGSQESGHFILLRRERPRVALRVDRAQDVVTAVPAADEESGWRTEAVAGLSRAETETPGEGEVIALLDVDRLLRPFLTPSSGA